MLRLFAILGLVIAVLSGCTVVPARTTATTVYPTARIYEDPPVYYVVPRPRSYVYEPYTYVPPSPPLTQRYYDSRHFCTCADRLTNFAYCKGSIPLYCPVPYVYTQPHVHKHVWPPHKSAHERPRHTAPHTAVTPPPAPKTDKKHSDHRKKVPEATK
jgi:hypothetical protein